MKNMKWITVSLLTVVLAFAGCSKSNQPPPGAPPPAAAIDVPKLRDACASGNAEVQAAAKRTLMAIQSGNFAVAGAELERLATNPSLTDAQKKVVQEVTEQVKQNMARMQAAPSQ